MRPGTGRWSGDRDSPEVRPRLEDQGGRSCLGIPEIKSKKNRAVIQTDSGEFR